MEKNENDHLRTKQYRCNKCLNPKYFNVKDGNLNIHRNGGKKTISVNYAHL